MSKNAASFANVFITAFFFLCACAVSARAQNVSLQDVRFSSQPQKFRIVMDVSGAPVYKTSFSGNVLSIVLKSTSLEWNPEAIQAGDASVSKIEIVPPAPDAPHLELNVHLAYPMPYRVFKLADPDRLVVDIMKYFNEKTVLFTDSSIEFSEVRMSDGTGLLSYYLMRFDPSQDALRIVPSLPNAVFSREKLSVLVQKSGAAGGINGGFFSKEGKPLGLIAVDGAAFTENLFHRTCLVEKKNGEFTMENVEVEITARFGSGQTLKIDGLNRPRKDSDIILYTPVFGTSTQTNMWGSEFLAIDNVLQGKDAASNNTVIPKNGYVFSLGAKRAGDSDLFAPGENVQVEFQLKPSDDFLNVLCAGPRLIKNGAVSITSKEEQFKPDVANGRAPRTAVGLTSDGELLLVVVDGRNALKSKGVTLQELAQLMHRLGAYNALNMDGGGSSTMVLGDLVVNSPSDGTERKIASALLLLNGNGKPGIGNDALFSEIFFKQPQPIPIFSEGN